MTDFIRNPSASLPTGANTTLISRQTSSGPQMFALSAVNFQNTSLNVNNDIQSLVGKLNQIGEVTVHEHKEK